MPSEHGGILIDGVQRGTTQRCPHCGGHFIVAAHGSLAAAKQTAMSDLAHPKIYCQKCGRLTCGRPQCNPEVVGCIPLEALLDYKEGRQTPYQEAIVAALEKGLRLAR